MENTRLAEAIYGRWNPNDVAYISGFKWGAEGDGTLHLTALIQPRTGKSGSWPTKSGSWFRAAIEFRGVRDLRVSKLGSGLRQIMGFSIEEVGNRGMEGLNFHVEDFEDGILEFYARTAKLLAVESLEQLNSSGSDLPP